MGFELIDALSLLAQKLITYRQLIVQQSKALHD